MYKPIGQFLAVIGPKKQTFQLMTEYNETLQYRNCSVGL